MCQEVKSDDGKIRLFPVSYHSRLLRGAEKNYIIPEKEGLGALFGVAKNSYHLVNRKCVHYTDNKALFNALKDESQQVNRRLQMFAVKLSPNTFTVKWRHIMHSN